MYTYRYTTNLKLSRIKNVRMLMSSSWSLSSRKEHLYGASPCHAAIFAKKREITKVFLNRSLKPSEDGGFNSSNILLSETIVEAQRQNLPMSYKSSGLLDRLSQKNPHQNIVVCAGKLGYKELPINLTPIPNSRHKLFMALDGVSDPMELGGILRSCAFFGVQNIIVNKNNSCDLNARVSKASSGALEWLNVYGVKDMHKFLRRAVESGWDVYGVDGEQNKIKTLHCTDVVIRKPSIVLFNCSKHDRMSDRTNKLCKQLVSVCFPEDGRDILKVSVRAGVVLHALASSMGNDSEG